MWSKNKINALVSSGGGAKGPGALFFFKADYKIWPVWSKINK